MYNFGNMIRYDDANSKENHDLNTLQHVSCHIEWMEHFIKSQTSKKNK